MIRVLEADHHLRGWTASEMNIINNEVHTLIPEAHLE